MVEISLALATGFLLAISLAPLLPSNHWSVRVWEFPRVQIAVLTVCVLLACVFITSPLLKISLLLLNALVLLYQILWIFPYTRLYPVQVAQADKQHNKTSIKILTSNVLMPNRSVHKLIELVEAHKPDVIVTLETDSWWEEALQPIHKDYPFRVNQALDNLYGMHLYSKYQLEQTEVINLIEDDIPSIHCYLRIHENLRVKCHFLHPAPPSPTENETATPRDRELVKIARQVANSGEKEPIIVTGDLNDVAWSPTTRQFRRISKLKDPRIGRGAFNTFHAAYPFLRWPLDHIFHSEHFMLGSIQRLPSIDSDHFPLLSELVYAPPVQRK